MVMNTFESFVLKLQEAEVVAVIKRYDPFLNGIPRDCKAFRNETDDPENELKLRHIWLEL